jgi:type II secretory pathway pseudopilin PulG
MHAAVRTRIATAASTVLILLLVPVALVVSTLQWAHFFSIYCHVLDRFVWVPYLLGGFTLALLTRALLRRCGLSDLEVSRRTRITVAVIFVPWIVVFFVVPSFLGAVDRGKQKKTMVAMREIGSALDSVNALHGRYPQATTVEELQAQLGPTYSLPTEDGWGTDFRLLVSADHYIIISNGRCGCPDFDDIADYRLGPQWEFEADILFSDCAFSQWPEGTQPLGARPLTR